jgi:hypothetical protein
MHYSSLCVKYRIVLQRTLQIPPPIVMMCSFVGWITNFIRQRHQAAASCAYAYSRLTFVRRMPPAIRTRLQNRQKRHNMNTSMRGFIAPYQIHEGRGSGELYVAPTNWRNNRALLDEDRVPLRRYTLTRYTSDLAFQCINNPCR